MSTITTAGYPYAIAASGSNLFVTTLGGVEEDSTSGTILNSDLISGLDGALGIAVYGTDIFVTNDYSGTVGQYTTSGATVNASLVKGLTDPLGITVDGGDLFVCSQNGQGGLLSEYDIATGALVSSFANPGNGFTPGGIVAVGSDSTPPPEPPPPPPPSSVPLPSVALSWAALLGCAAGLHLRRRRRRLPDLSL